MPLGKSQLLVLLRTTIICLPLFYIAIFNGFTLLDVPPFQDYSLSIIFTFVFLTPIFSSKVGALMPFISMRTRVIFAVLATFVIHAWVLWDIFLFPTQEAIGNGREPIYTQSLSVIFSVGYMFCLNIYGMIKLSLKGLRKNLESLEEEFIGVLVLPYFLSIIPAALLGEYYMLNCVAVFYIVQSYAMALIRYAERNETGRRPISRMS